MKTIILYILLLLPVISFAQNAEKNITGVWKGEFYVDSTKKLYPFELTISESKGKFTGYSRIEFEEKGIMQVVFRDHKIAVTDTSIIIEDDNQIAKASSVSQPKEVKKTMVLILTSSDSTMQLSGTWTTNKTRKYLAASGSVLVKRKIDFKSTAIFKKLEELSLADKLSFNLPPKEEILKLDKVILTGIAKQEFPKRTTRLINAVTRPDPQIRPKEISLAKIEKESPPPVAVITKPAPTTAKPAPVIKPRETIVAKVNKPVPKPVVAKETKSIAVVAAPVVKQNIPLPVQNNAAIDFAKRTINSEQSLFYKSDSLQLTLYDNGEIDGDTVSVLLNGKVIIAKKGLDTKPNSFTIYFDRNTPDSQMLVMYAENLGSIPPNTGLLVVREGKSVYELRFSADLKTNAAIILRRRREE